MDDRSLKELFSELRRRVPDAISVLAHPDKPFEYCAEVIEEIRTPRVFRGESLIVASKSFLESLRAVKKVLSELIQRDSTPHLATLATDRDGIFWHKFEELLLREVPFRPPVRDFLPVFHAAKECTDRAEGLRKLDELLRKEGALMRAWSRIDSPSKTNFETPDVQEREKLVVSLLTGLAAGKLTFEDFLYAIVTASRARREEKVEFLRSIGCRVGGKLPHQQANLSVVLAAIKRAQKKFEPEFSLQEIFGVKRPARISEMLLQIWLRTLVSQALSELDRGDFWGEGFRSLLKLGVALLLNRVRIGGIIEKELAVRHLLSLGRRLVDAPAPMTSLLIEAVNELSDDEFSSALFLQRMLEAHGPDVYLYCMRKVFADRRKALLATVLQMTFSSDVSVLSAKMISLAMKKKGVLRRMNRLLRTSGLAPKTVTAGMPWEVSAFGVDELLRLSRSAERYFKDSGIKPPVAISLLRRALREWSEVRLSGKRVKFDRAGVIAEHYARVAVAKDGLEEYALEVREVFSEDVPAVVGMLSEMDGFLSRLSEAWEKLILSDARSIYGEMVPVYRVPDIIRKLRRERPVLLVVVDGLRVDDYTTKLRPAIMTMGLRPIEEHIAVSMVPSVTAMARRSIFGGQESISTLALRTPPVGFKLEREDVLFSRVLGEGAWYVHGSFGTILAVLSHMIRASVKIAGLAIVLSEIEKAAHGATEAFLAKITLDYARQITRIIRAGYRTVKSATGEDPVVILASDHGLGAFTKRTSISFEEVERKMAKMRLLDAMHAPEVRERFALLPLAPEASFQDVRRTIEGMTNGQMSAIKASSLGYRKVVFKLKRGDIYDTIPADRVAILVARGGRVINSRSLRRGRVVFHGGISPIEMLVPLAVFSS